MGSSKRVAVPAAVLVLLLGVACGRGATMSGSDHEHDDSAGAEDHHDEGSGSASVTFGAPGDEADADRTIDVVMDDPAEYEPDEIEVAEGETVTFVVTNEGRTVHEFVIGDAAYQESHGAEMAAADAARHEEHEAHGAEGNAVTVDPGKTAKLTWRFAEAGELQFACHQPGHYERGMVGTLDVTL